MIENLLQVAGGHAFAMLPAVTGTALLAIATIIAAISTNLITIHETGLPVPCTHRCDHNR